MKDQFPRVVIAGRPNVGKSSLFNWIIGKRIAIVDPTAGVTRDRLVQRIDEQGHLFELVDTGGMGFDDPDGLTRHIDAQITINYRRHQGFPSLLDSYFFFSMR